jgi:predicted PurR-regulated permease PerM
VTTGDGPGAFGDVPRGLRTSTAIVACLIVLAVGGWLVATVLARLASLTLSLAATLLLAALIMPVARGLRRLHAPPWLAALGGVLSIVVIVAGPLALIGNETVHQWPQLQQGIGQGVDRIREWLLHGPMPISSRRIDAIGAEIRHRITASAPDPAAGASAAAQVAAAAVLALLLVFFVLKDGTSMWAWTLRMMPEHLRPRMDAAARAGWDSLVAYVRGTVVIAAVDATGIGIGLVVIGVPLAAPLALLTFIAAFVPIVGAAVAGAAAVIIAFVSKGITAALLVIAVVVGVQQSEGNLLQPLIMGRALRLHPAVILVAVTAGTLLAGIAGAVVAVPITAVAYRVFLTLRAPLPIAAPEAGDAETDADAP